MKTKLLGREDRPRRDVMVVHEDGVKSGMWKMGVVEGLICGRDRGKRGTCEGNNQGEGCSHN